ncbi:hypothetical protein D3C86_1451730 [compost metagenome]
MIRPADGGYRCDGPGGNRRRITRGQRALAVTDEVDLVRAGTFQHPLDLRQQLVAADFVAMAGRQVGDKHPDAGVPEGLLDVMEELEPADAIETEEPMDQQNRVASRCIPLHCSYLFHRRLWDACASL